MHQLMSPVSVVAALLLLSNSAVASDRLLIDAVQNADHATMLSLLDRSDVDTNADRGDGSTALSWATYGDDEVAVDLLIRAGADVNAASDFYNVTPLALACSNGNSNIVTKLLTAGADPNIAKRSGETPLMACANTGAEKGVLALLKHGANADATENKDDQTALMWAVAEKHPQLVQALVKNGADVAARSRVVSLPGPYVVDIDLDQGIWGSSYPDTTRWQKQSGGFNALYFAAQQGDVDSARILIEAGADINASHVEWGSVLNISIASGHEDFAVFLLEQGADPNVSDAWGVSPLHSALYKGLLIINRWRPMDSEHLGWERDNMPDLVTALLQHGADPGARIKFSYPYMEHKYIARSNDLPPQVSPVGATALHLAAISADAESMRILEPVSDPRATTIGGGTVFLFAAGAGVEKKARDGNRAIAAATLALEMGAGNVNDYLTDTVPGGPYPGVADGRTALHFATALGWTEVVEFLVEQGANIEARDRYGETPLMIALGDPEGRYYRQVGSGNYDLRFRRPGSTPGTGENVEIAELLLVLGAEPFTGKYRDASGL